VVRLDEAVLPLTDALGDLGVRRRYRVGPAERNHADLSYVEFAATAGGDALRPWSPVHVRARREAAGVRFSWIRRARRDGDAWEPVEVPLGEDGERYELDILAGSAVLRTLKSNTPEVLYPAAQELADFGALQVALSIRVAQLGTAIGRGFPRAATIPID
jgi:hypothetical protein